MRHTRGGGQELVRPAARAPHLVDDVGPSLGVGVDDGLDPGHQMLGAGGRDVLERFHGVRMIADGGLVHGEAHGDRQRRVHRVGDVAELAADGYPGVQGVHRDLGGAGQLAEPGPREPGAEQRRAVGVTAADAPHPPIAGGLVDRGDLGEHFEGSCRGVRQHADGASEESGQLVSHGYSRIGLRRPGPGQLVLGPVTAGRGLWSGSRA